jgi:hypothetical protein
MDVDIIYYKVNNYCFFARTFKRDFILSGGCNDQDGYIFYGVFNCRLMRCECLRRLDN